MKHSEDHPTGFERQPPSTGPATVVDAEQAQPRSTGSHSSPTLPQKQFDEGQPIARGGMSVVYKVYDHHFLRHVAMKKIDSRLRGLAPHTTRFVEEAQITGQLEHPNIIPVHNLGCNEDGFHFFTMKLIDGMTFAEYLQSDQHNLYSDASLYQTLQIFLKICDAVSFAHSRGVLHRDLKPANVMVGDHGQVYVMDWGIAYLLPDREPQSTVEDMYADTTSIFLQRGDVETGEESGDILGTWNYMAPEQALGQTNFLGFHTDVFALGAILYQILTGRPPYEGTNAYSVLQQAQEAKIRPPEEVVPHLSLPPGLSQIAMHAMHPNPALRYPNVERIKQEIELFLRSGGQLPLSKFEPGTLIIQEGDEGNAAYVITRGHCRAFRIINNRKVSLREMKAGDVFGETSIFLGQKRTASVEALDHVTLAIVDRKSLEQKLFRDSWLGRFVEAVAQRFVDLDSKWSVQSQELERSKILNFLYAYLCSTSTSYPMEAPWQPICEKLCQRLNYTPAQLLRAIETLKLFRVDPQNNRIYLIDSASPS